MKQYFRAISLMLAGILTLSLLIPSAAAEIINYRETSISLKNEVFNDPAFQSALEELNQTAQKENYTETQYMMALDELVLIVSNAQLGIEYVPTQKETAQFDFDKSTGTVLKVLNDAEELIIPSSIDGVTVRAIAPDAVVGKTELAYLILPDTIVALPHPIVRDCPNLQSVYAAPQTLVTSKLYTNCPLADSTLAESTYFETDVLGPQQLDPPKALLSRLGVFQGDNRGNKNWGKSLTRVEATVILLRLLGAEDEAQAAASNPSPFTDVPTWANGYVNLAYARGMVKGIGSGLFGPDRPCGGQEFSLMLLRLTDHTEGNDFSWATAVFDLNQLINAGRALERSTDYYTEMMLFPILYHGLPFTREHACALAYRTLSVPMADGKSSFGDTLCAKNSLSTTELADYGVRLTAAALAGRYDGNINSETHLTSLLYAMDNDAKDDAFKNQKPPTLSPEIQALAADLTRGLSDDYAKAKAISTWVSGNIAYDDTTRDILDENLFNKLSGKPVGGLEYPNQDASTVLKNGYGVCAGYSNLTKALMQAAGIPCLYVSSIVANHAWNEVYADGRWFPVDTTWNTTLWYEGGVITTLNEPDDYYFDLELGEFYSVHTLGRFPLDALARSFFS